MKDDADALDRLFEGCGRTLQPMEIAEILNVSLKSIYKHLKEGTLPGYKFGSSWIVITDEVKDTLRRGASKRPSDAPVIVVHPTIVEGE